MDPLAPIAGLSLESYAELRALCADHPDDVEACVKLAEGKGISRDDWLAAHAGWTERLEDTSLRGAVVTRFVPVYQAALGRAKGPAPTLSLEEFVLLSARIMHAGLSQTLADLELDLARYTQITFHWNAAISRDLSTFVAYVCMVEAELLRLHRGGEPRPIPGLTAPPAPQPEAAAAPAPAPEPAPAPAPAPAPPVAPTPPNPAPPPPPAPGHAEKSFEQEASEAAKAVGGALVSGLGKLGSALDSFGKNITKHAVGAHVLVQWSDGKKYPGKVAQVAQGQYFVTMQNGESFWVAEQYVSAA